MHNAIRNFLLRMKTIRDFAAAINSHDLEKIAALMSDDHTFIDAHGNEMTGKEMMKGGWGSYFQLFPDYYVEIEGIVTNADLAVAYGYAGAGVGEKAWKNPGSMACNRARWKNQIMAGVCRYEDSIRICPRIALTALLCCGQRSIFESLQHAIQSPR